MSKRQAFDMSKRQAFDMPRAIQAAWDFLWAQNLRQRREDEQAEHVYRAAATYFITASDLESQVRRFAKETLQGKAWGSTGRAWGREDGHIYDEETGKSGRLMLSGPGGRDLLGTVRDWLLRNPKIDGHNFGRGHISGMRFRPKGEPLHTSEEETIRRNEKRRADALAGVPRPRHYRKGGYGSAILCAKRHPFSRSSSRGRQPWGTSNWDEVTCKKCLNKRAEVEKA